MKKISNKFNQGALTAIIFLVIFAGIALKLENVGPTFSSFNPCPSLLSVATDDKKQFLCLNKLVKTTKLDHYFFFISMR